MDANTLVSVGRFAPAGSNGLVLRQVTLGINALVVVFEQAPAPETTPTPAPTALAPASSAAPLEPCEVAKPHSDPEGGSDVE